MEFDVNNVYTAVNADELHEGDLCILADTMKSLKDFVYSDCNPVRLSYIEKESIIARFVIGECSRYHLAYFVCPACNVEAYKAWKEGKAVEVTPYNPKHPYTRIENDGEEPDWTQGYYRPVVEQPKEKKYRPFKDCKELCDFWYKKNSRKCTKLCNAVDMGKAQICKLYNVDYSF